MMLQAEMSCGGVCCQHLMHGVSCYVGGEDLQAQLALKERRCPVMGFDSRHLTGCVMEPVQDQSQ